MAHIRKRKLPSGEVRWQVIWDQAVADPKIRRGTVRQTAMFGSHHEAKEKFASVLGSRPSTSASFRSLADSFTSYYEGLVLEGTREKSTLAQYKQHLNLHVLPDADFSKRRCGSIGTPEVQLYLDRLGGRVSLAMARKVRGTLTRVFTHGAQRGFVAVNPVTSSAVAHRTRPDVGEVAPFALPSKDQLRILLDAAKGIDNTGRAEAIVRTLMFGGLRISELRGLRRLDCVVIGQTPQIRITQRADRYNKIGPVKSQAALRSIDLGPDGAQALRVWLMAAPTSDLVFPNEDGGIQSYPNLWNRFWVPLLNAAGLVSQEPASKAVSDWSKAQVEFKQPLFGFHTLRHVYASLQIERGVTPKRLQKLMGHATLKMTLDTYGHLWPDEDADRDRARGVENAI